MRKVILFLVFATINFYLAAQNDIPFVKQIAGRSCWAASLEMMTKGSIKQCDAISFVLGNDKPFCSCENPPVTQCNTSTDRSICRKVSTVDFSKINIITLNKLGNTTTNYDNISISLNSIKNNLPLMYNYADGTNHHMVAISDVVSQNFSSNKKIDWLKINDPWPVCTGRQYYITYEKYKFQNLNAIATNKVQILSFNANLEKISNDPFISGNNFQDNEGSLVTDFVDKIKNYSKFDAEFTNITGLENNQIYKIGKRFDIIESVVHKLKNQGETIDYDEILNTFNYKLEKLYSINLQNSDIPKTALTISKYKDSFLQPPKWKGFLHKIENGDFIQNFSNARLTAISVESIPPQRDIYVKMLNNSTDNFFEKVQNRINPQSKNILFQIKDIEGRYLLFLLNKRIYAYDPFGKFDNIGDFTSKILPFNTLITSLKNYANINL